MIVQPEQLSMWLSKANNSNGIYFLDFETTYSSVPLFDKAKPYTQVPFQYSLHYRNNKDRTVSHFEFLADPNNSNDMRLEFIESLIHNLSDISAPIIVWNAQFELGCLKYMAILFPQYAPSIERLKKNFLDQMTIFKDKVYYDPRFKASYSIKNVLPVLCPGMSYESLAISNGTAAAYEFSRMFNATETEKKMIRNSLLEYCKQDTEAMVKILEFLETEMTSINANK